MMDRAISPDRAARFRVGAMWTRQSIHHCPNPEAHGGVEVCGDATRITPTPFSIVMFVPNGFDSRRTFSRISCATSGVGIMGMPILEIGRYPLPTSTG